MNPQSERMPSWRSLGCRSPDILKKLPEGEKNVPSRHLFPPPAPFPQKAYLKIISNVTPFPPSPPLFPSPLKFQGCRLGLLCHHVWNSEWGPENKRVIPGLNRLPLMKCAVQFPHLLNSWSGQIALLSSIHAHSDICRIRPDSEARDGCHFLCAPFCFFVSPPPSCFVWGCDLPRVSNSCLPPSRPALLQARALEFSDSCHP